MANLASFDFELTKEEMQAIDALDGTLENSRTQPNPDEVEIIFENTGDQHVKAYWVDQSGKEVLTGEISPKAELSQKTYHSHKFRFIREGDVVDEHVVSKEGGRKQRYSVEL